MFKILKDIFLKKDKPQLKNLIKDGAYLVDVRSPEEFAEGHVNGSVNIPVERIQTKLDAFRNKSHIIVFCRSGMRSGLAKSILEKNGFSNISNGGTWRSVNDLVKN